MKQKKYILIILITTVLFSCEKVLEYDFPEQPKKLVIYSFFSPDSVWTVSVYKLQHVLNKIDTVNYYVTDATVKLYENNNYLETLQHIEKGKYISQNKPKEKSTYYIEVIADGFPIAVSEKEKVPKKVTINSFTHTDSLIENLFTQTDYLDIEYAENYAYTYLVNLRTEEDYIQFYSQNAKANFSDNIYSKYNWYSRDIIKLNKLKSITDNFSFFLSIYTDYLLSTEDTCMAMYIHSVTKSYANFERTSFEQNGGITDPFLSAENIYTNINNGLGIFAAYSSTTEILLPIQKLDSTFHF